MTNTLRLHDGAEHKFRSQLYPEDTFSVQVVDLGDGEIGLAFEITEDNGGRSASATLTFSQLAEYAEITHAVLQEATHMYERATARKWERLVSGWFSSGLLKQAEDGD